MSRQTVDKIFFLKTIGSRLSNLQPADVPKFQEALATVLDLGSGKTPIELSAQTAQALGFRTPANTVAPTPTTWELNVADLTDIKYHALSVYIQRELLSFSAQDKEKFLKEAHHVLASSSSTTFSWLPHLMGGQSKAKNFAQFLKGRFFFKNNSITVENLEKVFSGKEQQFFEDTKQNYLFKTSALLVKQATISELKNFFTTTEEECYKQADAFVVKKEFNQISSKQHFTEYEKGYLKIFLVHAASRVIRDALFSSSPDDARKTALKCFSEAKLEEGTDGNTTYPALEKIRQLLSNSNTKLAINFLTKNEVESLQKSVKAHLEKLNQPVNQKTPKQQIDDFLSKSKEVLAKDEAAKLQKEIADFINKSSNSDLAANSEELYSKALTAYVIVGALISDGSDAGKKTRKEFILKLLTNPLNIDFQLVKKVSCETPCLITENKFNSVPSSAISQAVKSSLTLEVLLTHIALTTPAVQLREWVEVVGKDPKPANLGDTLKAQLESHIKTFFLGQEAVDQTELAKINQAILPGNDTTQTIFTKIAVFKLLEARINAETDVTKLQELFKRNPDEIKGGDVDVLRGKPQCITQDQLQKVWADINLKKKLQQAVEARAIQLAKKPGPTPEFATTVRFEALFGDFKTVVQKVVPGAKIDTDNENIATVTEGSAKTTIERISPATDGTGGGVKVTGSHDAVVKTLAKLYVEELAASKKINRDPMGKISAHNGFAFQLSSNVINLHKKDGGYIAQEERRTFLEALDKELNAQLPNIYVAGSITKVSSADLPEDEDPTITSRLFRPSIFNPVRQAGVKPTQALPTSPSHLQTP